MTDGSPSLTIYAIYEHPLDAPDEYVVRAWLVNEHGRQPGDSSRAPTLDVARTLLPADVERVDIDDPDPAIIEQYM